MMLFCLTNNFVLDVAELVFSKRVNVHRMAIHMRDFSYLSAPIALRLLYVHKLTEARFVRIQIRRFRRLSVGRLTYSNC